ncbi:MAG: LolA family protein [Chloroflexota bacterium]
MTFLRRISTRQLIALAAALVAVAAGTTAIAIAATGGGPTPPPKPLDEAVHDALSAPPVEGVTARVHFTDNLIGESVLEGADPILGGASGRLWATADGRVRVELQADVAKSSAGDFELLVDGRRFSVYDPGTETVYEGTLPRHGEEGDEEAAKDEPPTLAQVQEGIEEASRHLDLSGAIPSDVAGRATYAVHASPKADGGLVGGAELAWDAANGVPLRAAVYAKGESSPVLELSATEVSFGPVPASVFEVTPPPGTKVVELSPPEEGKGEGDGSAEAVTGLEAVQAKTAFAISAPPTLAGMERDQVRLVASGEDAGALVTYGKGLGGLAVLELPAGKAPSGEGGEPGGLQLPSVEIEGASQAQELETPLGTLIRFKREGVEYTVAGSVTSVIAREAARGL